MLGTYTGNFGSGKTYMLAEQAYNCAKRLNGRNRVSANFELRMPHIKSSIWSSVKDEAFVEAVCGLLLIDEAGKFFDSRKFAALPDEARDKVLEHRKDDIHILMAMQDVTQLDAMFRRRGNWAAVMNSIKLPFIGWFYPTCIARTKLCTIQHKDGDNCKRVPLDVVPDDIGWRKYFGVGTVLLERRYNIADLMVEGTQNAIQSMRAENGIKPLIPIKTRVLLFNNIIAAAYDTHRKVVKT